ncbi:hypothetical protein, partial [Pseudomonas aeruginosa]|uniref:hypothetical protein n=3 Tax=Pseudomonas aeruginosa TaxID=287 RepID=UPI0031B71C92
QAERWPEGFENAQEFASGATGCCGHGVSSARPTGRKGREADGGVAHARACPEDEAGEGKFSLWRCFAEASGKSAGDDKFGGRPFVAFK